MTREVPKISRRSIEAASPTPLLLEQIERLLKGDVPMLHLPANKGIDPARPPLRRTDTRIISQALSIIGFRSRYERRYFTGDVKPYDPIAKDDGWHVDTLPDTPDRNYYPFLGYMTLRRHTAVGSAAFVQARTTQLAPSGRSGFKRDTSAPIYEACQQPGDSVYFISLGGIASSWLIPQTEHKFVAIEETPRKIHIGEFEFRPTSLVSLEGSD